MSLDQLLDHRRIWRNKATLRAAYAVWFEQLLAVAQAGERVLEIGSGPGSFSEYARGRRPDISWTSVDLIPAPWNDLAADALRLPVRDASLDCLLGVDVIHHLARPHDFLAEAGRTLRAGGRLALIEPWVTPFSYPIYRWLHQEDCRLDLDPTRPFGDAEAADKPAFQGDAAVLWRLVRVTRGAQWQELGLGRPRIRASTAFAYILSLGFRDASLLPGLLLRPALWLDRLAQPAASLLGMRALATWERSARSSPGAVSQG